MDDGREGHGDSATMAVSPSPSEMLETLDELLLSDPLGIFGLCRLIAVEGTLLPQGTLHKF